MQAEDQPQWPPRHIRDGPPRSDQADQECEGEGTGGRRRGGAHGWFRLLRLQGEAAGEGSPRVREETVRHAETN